MHSLNKDSRKKDEEKERTGCGRREKGERHSKEKGEREGREEEKGEIKNLKRREESEDSYSRKGKREGEVQMAARRSCYYSKITR